MGALWTGLAQPVTDPAGVPYNIAHETGRGGTACDTAQTVERCRIESDAFIRARLSLLIRKVFPFA